MATRSQIKNHENLPKRLRVEVIERRLNNTLSLLNDTSTTDTKITLQFHFKQIKVETLPTDIKICQTLSLMNLNFKY